MTAGERDPCDAQLVAGAGGLLREFNRAGVLDAADVHVATRLTELAAEPDQAVALAVALAVRAPRRRHVLVDLERAAQTVAVEGDPEVPVADLPWPEPAPWLAQLAGSPLVEVGDDPGPCGLGRRPLRLVGSWLYLDRLWHDERQVAEAVRQMAGQEPAPDDEADAAGIQRLFGPGPDTDDQRRAAAVALSRRLAVIAGGPGTGKTTTVARVAALLLERAHREGRRLPLIALAAPTGKAAVRLGEAVREEAGRLDLVAEVRVELQQLPALTLHRLLGRAPDRRSRFRHGPGRRLPHDVIIVDETSMVPLWLMARLLEALRPQARLLLVGDPDQLVSIEAGAVLGDIVGPARERRGAPGLGSSIVVLERGRRFAGGIAELADAVRGGDAEGALALLRSGREDVEWLAVDAPDDAVEALRPAVVAAARAVQDAARGGDAGGALAALEEFRLLCAHRRGPAGVAGWNARVEAWLASETAAGADDFWTPGRPVLITHNDYEQGLYNGDSGVVVAGEDGSPVAVFRRGGGIIRLAPSRLESAQTLYALTIHRSQGSQFQVASVLLPEPGSRLLTRELLYTAITRAQRRLVLAGSEAALRTAVERPVARASGLRWRLWGEK